MPGTGTRRRNRHRTSVLTPSPPPPPPSIVIIIITIISFHILSLVRIDSKLCKGFQSPLPSYPFLFFRLISDHLSPCKQITLRPSEISHSLSVSYFGTYYSFYTEHSYSSSPCLDMTSQKLSMIPKFRVK